MRLLAVDDDPIALAIVEASLAEAGYESYETAASAEEALRKIRFQKHSFECFLLDINMPGMNGIELCKEIRAEAGHENAQIIMLTSAKDKQSVEQAFQAGANDYVNKPIDLMELQTRLIIADTLVEKAKEVGEASEHVSELQRRVSGLDELAASTPITLPGIPNVISKMAMENYLLALTRLGLFKSKTVGFAVAEFDEIFLKAESEDLFELLSDVAKAIAASLESTSYLMAYYGYGEFIAVTGRQSSLDPEELEHHVASTLNKLGLEYETGEALELHVIVGPPQRCSLLKLNAPLSLARNAIASVEEARSRWRSNHLVGFKKENYRDMRR